MTREALGGLTILVTCKDRQENLRRVCSYYAAHATSLLVIDSSRRSWSEATPAGARYFHRPDLGLYQLLRLGLQEAETPYVLWLNDDDLALIPALRSACEVLERRPEVSACHGLYLRFSEQSLDLVPSTYMHHLLPRIGRFDGHQGTVERVQRDLRDFVSLSHAVLRRQALARAVDVVIENPPLYPVRFFDKIVTFCAALDGETATLATVFQLRSDDRMLKTQREYPAELERAVGMEAFPARHHRAGRPLAALLAERTGLDTGSAAQLVEVAFRPLVERERSRPRPHRALRRVRSALRRVRAGAPMPSRPPPAPDPYDEICARSEPAVREALESLRGRSRG